MRLRLKISKSFCMVDLNAKPVGVPLQVILAVLEEKN